VGLKPIEAFASGTPVIGVRDGFTQYQIVNGVNGRTYANEGRVAAIHEAVRKFERDGIKMDDTALERFAENFSFERFAREMHDTVERMLEKTTIQSTVDEYILDGPGPLRSPEAGGVSE